MSMNKPSLIPLSSFLICKEYFQSLKKAGSIRLMFELKKLDVILKVVEFFNRERVPKAKTITFFYNESCTLNMATICRGILYTNYIWSYYQDKSISRTEKRALLVTSSENGGSFPGMFYYHRCMRLECRGVYGVYDNHKQMAVSSLVPAKF